MCVCLFVFVCLCLFLGFFFFFFVLQVTKKNIIRVRKFNILSHQSIIILAVSENLSKTAVCVIGFFFSTLPFWRSPLISNFFEKILNFGNSDDVFLQL